MTISVESLQDRCRETAGFLFSHPCKNPATARCSLCGKPICAEHSRTPSTAAPAGPPPAGGWPDAGGAVCIGCTRRQAVEQNRQQELAGRQDDPYFFAWAFYPDYESYSSAGSYSEADRAAFAAEGAPTPEEGWEKDWDAS